MNELTLGLLYGGATLLAMLCGMPIAFALGSVALIFMLIFMPAAALDTVAQNVYEEVANIVLLSLPLFILKGVAIGQSPAGRDLYRALHAWMRRIPGGLGIANVFACGLFAAMAGSSPATCAAIGSAGIPEMRARGYPADFAAGIIAAGGTLGILLPPSITMILYAVAAKQSLGRLFLAGIVPGIALVALFSLYVVHRYRREYAKVASAVRTFKAGSPASQEPAATLRERVALFPRVLPFIALLIGVMVALYGGYATPSETAGLGALMALVLLSTIYRIWRPSQLRPILQSTLSQSSMLLLIVGMSLLYSYVTSYLYISQSAAQWLIDLQLPKWALLASILTMIVLLGFFLPPVSIILMTAPIILPPLEAAGFDLVWFGVIMMIVMEMGLIHPPVGLNLFVIKSTAPDIPFRSVVCGALPFVALMLLAVLLLCLFPSLSLWLPATVMGVQ